MKEFEEVTDTKALKESGLKPGLVFVYRNMIYVCMDSHRQLFLNEYNSTVEWRSYFIYNFLAAGGHLKIYQLNPEGKVFNTVKEFVLTHMEKT